MGGAGPRLLRAALFIDTLLLNGVVRIFMSRRRRREMHARLRPEQLDTLSLQLCGARFDQCLADMPVAPQASY